MDRAALLREIEAEFSETRHCTGRATMSPNVAAALARVPREAFVSPGSEEAAYENRPLPIGQGQTISQPFIVALMTDLLDLTPEDRVLEVGTGSGYQAAVLAELARTVYSVEVVPELAARAATVLAGQSYTNVELRTADGGLGWPERAPFDAIIVTAAAPDVPASLVEQLRPGGRMVLPVGPPGEDQELVLLIKGIDGTVTRRTLLPVAFVPLIDRRD